MLVHIKSSFLLKPQGVFYYHLLMIFAHSKPFQDKKSNSFDEWEPLFTADGWPQPSEVPTSFLSLDAQYGHLNKVALLCSHFAGELLAKSASEAQWASRWAYQVGLWHDLGKFAPEWQRYLIDKTDPHKSECSGKLDHSTAGAQHINQAKFFGPLFAYLIAGHHSGLADGNELFYERLKKTVSAWEEEARKNRIPLEFDPPELPKSLHEVLRDPFSVAFLARMLFSCLVDADFLATEAFMRPEATRERPSYPHDILKKMQQSLEHYYKGFGTPAADDELNLERAKIHHSCLSKASEKPGYFSLTVPTGGGKTLASLAFALKHAVLHGLKRIIYVVPYTSIIEQNADVFRHVFKGLEAEIGLPVVLEHHANFEPRHERESMANRYLTENWDAPLIVTTNVQFFESLLSNRPGSCRKVHRIAHSAVIFDEVQSLPYRLLSPILASIKCLVKTYGVTAVLCTATQPALEKRDNFTNGIECKQITEIIPDRSRLFNLLKRVETYTLGEIPTDDLCRRVVEESSRGVLVIVNTTKMARELCERLKNDMNAPLFHLSARMCPAHRRQVIREVRRLTSLSEPVVLISTQLIEAGVDVSFPVVFRSLCGLDAFAQSAGRCNRNGELRDASGHKMLGKVYLFSPSEYPIPKTLADIRAAADVTAGHILSQFKDVDLLSLKALECYFRVAIWQAGKSTQLWDNGKDGVSILKQFNCGRTSKDAFHALKFKTAAEHFKLIDEARESLIIPWNDEAFELRNEILRLQQYGRSPSREHFRKAQSFAVGIHLHEFNKLAHKTEHFAEDALHWLIQPENDYDSLTGLKTPDSNDNPLSFLI